MKISDGSITAHQKKTILENEYSIPMNKDLGREMEKMCNLSEAIEERGIEKGSKQNAKENAKRFFENGVSYQIVRASIENLTDEELQQIYDEAMKENTK